MRVFQRSSRLIMPLLTGLLVACGGGSSAGGPTNPADPTAPPDPDPADSDSDSNSGPDTTTDTNTDTDTTTEGGGQ